MSPCKLALRNVKHYPGFDSLMEGSMAFEQECEVCYTFYYLKDVSLMLSLVPASQELIFECHL